MRHLLSQNQSFDKAKLRIAFNIHRFYAQFFLILRLAQIDFTLSKN